MRHNRLTSPISDAARHLSHRSDERATKCSALAGAGEVSDSTVTALGQGGDL